MSHHLRMAVATSLSAFVLVTSAALPLTAPRSANASVLSRFADAPIALRAPGPVMTTLAARTSQPARPALIVAVVATLMRHLNPELETRPIAGATAAPVAASVAAPIVKPTVKAVPKPTVKAVPKPTVTASFRGKNHFWAQTMGISQQVYGYSCGNHSTLANVVYRWGCGGRNNVYVMAHNFGKFHGLYSDYYSKSLKKGQVVMYADTRGKTHYYKLAWWKIVAPYGNVGFAYAAQSVPSLTMQTCVGKNGSLRLVVRFTEFTR